jgi:hypothetical protein
MPITGPIPLPNVGIDAFWQGANNTQNMINSIMKNKYDQSMLGVNQARQEYNKAILPYLIQQYQTNARKAKLQEDLYNYAFGQNNNPQDNQFAQPQNQSSPVIRPPMDNQTVNGMSREQLVGIANRDQANYDAAHGYTPQQQSNINPQQMANQGMVQQPENTLPQSQIQNAPNEQQTSGAPVPDYIHSNLQNNLPNNQEMVIRQGDPSREKMNRAAGMTIMGIRIPDIKSNTVDGIRYDTYPNGKITAQKVGPSADEKAQIALQAAENREQAKSDIKASADIEKDMPGVISSMQNMASLYNIAKRNKNSTGFFYKLPFSQTGTHDPDTSEFITRSNAAQAEIARANTGKNTGIKSLMLAKFQKPDVSFSNERNLTASKTNLEIAKNTFDVNKARWERYHPGKSFPFKIPDEVNQILSSPTNKDNTEKMVLVRDNLTNKVTKMTMSDFNKLKGTSK